MGWTCGSTELANSDIGFAINRQIRQIAFLHGRPRIAFVQGTYAIFDVKDHQDPDLSSDGEGPAPKYTIWKGEFRGFEHRTPIIGFPLLTSQSTFTIDQRLGMIGAAIQANTQARR